MSHHRARYHTLAWLFSVVWKTPPTFTEYRGPEWHLTGNDDDKQCCLCARVFDNVFTGWKTTLPKSATPVSITAPVGLSYLTTVLSLFKMTGKANGKMQTASINVQKVSMRPDWEKRDMTH